MQFEDEYDKSFQAPSGMQSARHLKSGHISLSALGVLERESDDEGDEAGGKYNPMYST